MLTFIMLFLIQGRLLGGVLLYASTTVRESVCTCVLSELLRLTYTLLRVNSCVSLYREVGQVVSAGWDVKDAILPQKE